jgi:dipeptidyl aminopeptidase/acylaminoacyl peptidase
MTTGDISWKSDGGAIEPIHAGLRGSPSSWSPDGRLLAFVDGNDISIVDVSGSDRTARVVIQSPSVERFPEFSPDGRWLAFTSNESGNEEVFVQPFPGPGRRVQITRKGGVSPLWRRDQKELFYLLPGPKPVVMSVAITTSGQELQAGEPRYLFEGDFQLTGPVRGYDVSPDGQRFFMVQRTATKPEPPIQLVLINNWFDELRSRVPGAGDAKN